MADANNKWIQEKGRNTNEASTKIGTAQCWKTFKEIKTGLAKTAPVAEKMVMKAGGIMCTTTEENA